MSDASRRGFLAAVAGATGATLSPLQGAQAETPAPGRREPFYGAHQAGVVTPSQGHVYFAAFDLATNRRAEVGNLMRDRTTTAARLASGETPAPEADGAEVAGLDPARLTVSFGFGPNLFVENGHDRFGLKALRPEAFVDLPAFPGEELAPARSGGDLVIQICADNPQVAFHAARAFNQRAYGAATLRWVQSALSRTMDRVARRAISWASRTARAIRTATRRRRGCAAAPTW